MNKTLSAQDKQTLLDTLQDRFESNMDRHAWCKRDCIETKLHKNSAALWSLHQMELTWWEPDVIDYDTQTDQYLFADCSVQTPKDRRSICYDRAWLESRKKFKPDDTAMDMAKSMGIELMTQQHYTHLQTLWAFDTKTSSRIHTPQDIRTLGWALFGDRRYDTVFFYHNGADSYYAARGFRGVLSI